MPENYAAPQRRTIWLNVVVFRALRPLLTHSAQFDLEGGPGFAVTESASFYATDGVDYRRDRDVVLFDMRGTGSSNPLRCTALEKTSQSDPLAPLYPPELVSQCAAELSKIADLRQYSTAAAARDIEMVRVALGYERIDLNALSYGTTLALRYIAEYSNHVRTAVLTGAVPASKTPPRFHALAAADGLRRLLASCTASAHCAAMYPDLQQDLQSIARALAPAQREVFMEKLRAALYLPLSSRHVPALIHGAASGINVLTADESPTRAFSDGLYLSITCAESIARMDVEQAIRDSDATPFGAYRLRRQRDACAHWPLAPRDARLFRLPRSDIPVLFLSGAFDPVSHVEWASEIAARFSHSAHLIVPQGAHVMEGLTGMETCLDPIVLQFVASRSMSGIDASCIASMSNAEFSAAPQ